MYIMGLFDRFFVDWYWVEHTKAWDIPNTEELKPYIPTKMKIVKWLGTIVGFAIIALIIALIMSINTDVYGNFALYGSIFMSSMNARDLSDPYTLIYGHHMDNGGMFGDVVEFVNTDYFSEPFAFRTGPVG